jgi:ribonuclease T1
MFKNKKLTNWLIKIFTVLFLFVATGCEAIELIDPSGTSNSNISSSQKETPKDQTEKEQSQNKDSTNIVKVNKGQNYSTKEEVAAYIHEFKELPPNFVTKAQAQKLGWDNTKGNLWEVTDKKSIGGDRFGNMEGLLPKADGRKYYECDINYKGGYRGAERIVYSSDGLIFYSGDHYKTFKQLY